MNDEQSREYTTWETARRLSVYARPYWHRIGIAFLFLMATVGAELVKPWPLKIIFDSILTKSSLDGHTLYLLVGVTVLVVFTAVFDGLLSYWQTYHINVAARHMVFDLRAKMFDHVQRLSLQFHSRRRSGDLMQRVTGDVDALKDMFTDSVIEVLYAIFLLAGMAIFLLVIDWKLALVALVFAPIFYVFAIRYTRRIKSLARQERRYEGALSNVLHESLGAIRLTRVFNREEAARAKFEQESRGTVDLGMEATMAGAQFGWTVDVLKAIVTALVLGFGAQRVMSGSLTPGELYVFVTYVRGFYKPLQTTMKHSARVFRATARAERIVELLDEKEGVTDLPGARPAPALEGRVEFRGVSFAYEPPSKALEGVDLVVPAHQVTALVGATGAGKTTLASLIPRLYDPTEGAVLIDGHDVREYTLASLRSQVSMVLQESVLFRASVEENIAYGRHDATFDEIVQAAKDANAHEFIVKLEEGYQTVIGERGDTLSGGQRQRIAIARAMVRNAPILILDEPLAGLDVHAATTVLEALDRLMEGKTTIVITHDLATVQRAGYAVLLQHGHIVQQGPVADLAAADGPYRKMLQAQFRDVEKVGDVLTASR